MPWNALFRLARKIGAPHAGTEAIKAVEPLTHQDTKAAILELSLAVRNNPESVEIYLALGNLYRSQGEIERAIHIRTSLIERPGLSETLKARCHFELGRDFRRGGMLDKARNAFEAARKIQGDSEEIELELARLAADSGDFERAAQHYERIKRPMAEAHFLTQQAREHFRLREDNKANALLERALRAFPASPEAWLATVVHSALSGNLELHSASLRNACTNIPAPQRFLLLEDLLMALSSCRFEDATQPNRTVLSPAAITQLVRTSVSVLSKFPPDALICYYCAKFCLFEGDRESAKHWLEKALVLNADFWLARLELVTLVLVDQELTPFLREQLAYFINHARKSKRFVCNSCGFRWDKTFFVCPRCRSWHTILFRQEFS